MGRRNRAITEDIAPVVAPRRRSAIRLHCVRLASRRQCCRLHTPSHMRVGEKQVSNYPRCGCCDEQAPQGSGKRYHHHHHASERLAKKLTPGARGWGRGRARSQFQRQREVNDCRRTSKNPSMISRSAPLVQRFAISPRFHITDSRARLPQRSAEAVGGASGDVLQRAGSSTHGPSFSFKCLYQRL
jgi:hypothetical protein